MQGVDGKAQRSALSNGGKRTVRFTLPSAEDYGRAPVCNDLGDADVVLRRDELKAMAVSSCRKDAARRRRHTEPAAVAAVVDDDAADVDDQFRLSARRRLKAAPRRLKTAPAPLARGVSPISTGARLARGSRRTNALAAQQQILAELDFGDIGGALGALDTLERRRQERHHSLRLRSADASARSPARDRDGRWHPYSAVSGPSRRLGT